MTTIRVLRTAKATLSRVFYLDEVATGASGSVTITIKRQDGTTVESGNAVGPDSTSAYAYTFGGRDVLDELDVIWSATVGGDAIVLDQDVIEVVGGFYFGLAEGRASDRALADATKFPTADLIDRRIEVETECERLCGQAFVPRFRRVTVNGTGAPALIMPDPLIRVVRSVQIGATAFTIDQVAAVGVSDAGMLYLSQGWQRGVPSGARNVTVEYEYGNDRPPADIIRAAKTRWKSMLLEGRANLPDRAERQVQVDSTGSTVVYGSATAERTGIPSVDAVYARFPSPRPGFG